MVTALLLLIALAWVVLLVWRRRVVAKTSAAIKQVDELNARSRGLFIPPKPFRLVFETTVTSKARLDKFDLQLFLRESLLGAEPRVANELKWHQSTPARYRAYQAEFHSLASGGVGKSSHPRIKPKKFLAIENRLLRQRHLRYQKSTSRAKAIVRYTSPRGRQVHWRHIEWDSGQLSQALAAAFAERAHRSTVEGMREQERRLMKPGLRVDILRRDNYRCQMCGASQMEGAALHVDHIKPISHGGRTVPENLQTLCRSCNLGKSNRFVG